MQTVSFRGLWKLLAHEKPDNDTVADGDTGAHDPAEAHDPVCARCGSRFFCDCEDGVCVRCKHRFFNCVCHDYNEEHGT